MSMSRVIQPEKPVIDAMCEKAAQSVSAEGAIYWQFGKGKLRALSTWDSPELVAELRESRGDDQM